MRRFTDEERVRRGIALLDEHGPEDWRTKLTEPLNLNDTWHCVLGQVYGSYWRAIESGGPLQFLLQGGIKTPGYGFSLYYEEDDWRCPRATPAMSERRLAELTAEWNRQLNLTPTTTSEEVPA